MPPSSLFILVRLVSTKQKNRALRQRDQSINDYIFSGRAGLGVDTNLEGELPRILRHSLAKQRKEAKEDEEVGRVRTRRVVVRLHCCNFAREVKVEQSIDVLYFTYFLFSRQLQSQV